METEPQSYVDDMMTMPKDAKSLREACLRIGAALEEISLRSHPDKTEVIVTGRNKKAEKLKETLTQDPAVMQGNSVKLVESGMYLGMRVSQKGHRDTVDLTVKHRVAKAWGRAADIKTVINDANMRCIGWLRAGIELTRSIIIPSLTYSSDVWIMMNKATEKYLVDEYKSMLYIIFDLRTHTKWTSILADLGLPNIMAVVDKLRLNYVNHTLWGNGDVKLKELLEEEHRVKPGNSVISIIDELCAKYKIPKISGTKVDKRIIKRQVRLMDEIEIWISNILSPATENVGLERIRLSTNFYKLSKKESQCLLAYNAGALELKTAKGDYHDVKNCLAPMCDGLDELGHIKKCPYYTTKWEDEFLKDSKLFAIYLAGVDKERRRRYKGECLY